MKAQLAIIPVILAGIGFYLCTFVVKETDHVIITKFGQLVGDPISEPGLHFKMPFIHEVNRIEKRFLPWDGPSNEMSTKDKTYLIIDTFARLSIEKPKTYFLRLRDERSAISRLNGILGSETRNAVARHELIEIIRTDKNRVAKRDVSLGDRDVNATMLRPIQIGRNKVEDEIFNNAKDKLEDFGIKLLDIRFKRINYNETVRRRIYERMISERQQIASRFRSEGAGEAAKIVGKKERELQRINSEAYRKVEEIYGEADAKASAIYAEAYDQSPASSEFYTFLKTLETYREVMKSDISLVLTTDSPLFKLLKSLGKWDQAGSEE